MIKTSLTDAILPGLGINWPSGGSREHRERHMTIPAIAQGVNKSSESPICKNERAQQPTGSEGQA